MGARVLVDFDRCTGHGRCYTVSPDLLDEDEEGFVSARWEPVEVPSGRLSEADEAAAVCPERALRVERE